MSGNDRARLLEFIALCREHFIAFACYGPARVREVLQADDGIAQDQRTGAWRTEYIYNAWLSYQRRNLGNETAEVGGWIPQKNETQNASTDTLADTGRAERVQLLSEDGLTDPRNEWTKLDAQFIILFKLSSLPTTFQAMAEPDRVCSSTTRIAEARMKQNLEVIDQLDGRVPLPVGL